MYPILNDGETETNQQALDAFEDAVGLKLPRAYREFLLHNNGGRPQTPQFPIHGMAKNPNGTIQYFFGLSEKSKNYGLEQNYRWYAAVPRKILLIACTGQSDFVGLDLRAGGTAIKFWDQRGFWGNGIWSEDDLYDVAPDFSSFLTMLR